MKSKRFDTRLRPIEIDPFHPQAIDDGLLEVVGIYSSFHIAQLQIGLSKPYYIGQASEIKVSRS